MTVTGVLLMVWSKTPWKSQSLIFQLLNKNSHFTLDFLSTKYRWVITSSFFLQ